MKVAYARCDQYHRYSISRRVGYEWLDRFLRDGLVGLTERSRQPHASPAALEPALTELLLATRRAHPTWGPHKILAYLARRHCRTTWQAPSTVGTIFKAYGLVRSRPRRRPLGHPGRPTTPMTAPNDVWTADFKGHFATGDGRRCHLHPTRLPAIEYPGHFRVYYVSRNGGIRFGKC